MSDSHRDYQALRASGLTDEIRFGIGGKPVPELFALDIAVRVTRAQVAALLVHDAVEVIAPASPNGEPRIRLHVQLMD